jgi:predicted amidohydrolase
MRCVTIAAVQMALQEADIAGNSVRALELLDRAGRAGAGLAVLPEMWWTGFSFRRLPAFADETPASLRAVGEVARRYGMAVIGSWPEKEGDRVFNTAYVIGADGEVRGSYRKVHLFRPMKEDLFLSPGNSLTTVDLDFGKVGIAICYDLRFPDMARKLALAGAEVIAVPSQWPDVRIEHFWMLLRARAIENQLFVVGANRTGWGGKLRFGGYSAVIGPAGETHAEGGGKDGLALAEVDLDAVAEARREMCHLDDRVPGVDD